MKTETENSIFPLADRREIGYDCAQVDEFLQLARAAYDKPSAESEVSAQTVREMSFRVVKKGGYSARYVDAAMDRLEDVFAVRAQRQAERESGQAAQRVYVSGLRAEVLARGLRPKGKRFRRRGILATGYNRSQVDAFMDRALAGLAGRGLVTASQVRESVFHMAWRGYDEAQVDAYLDAIIELLLLER